MSRWRRALRGLVILLVVLAVGGTLVFHSNWLRDKLRQIAMTQASKVLTGNLTIGRLSGSLWSDVVLDDVTIVQPDGPVFHADHVSVRYDAMTLVHKHLIFDDIVVDHPVVKVTQRAGGWNVGRMIRQSNGAGAPVDFSIARLRVNGGDVEIAPIDGTPRHLENLNADLRIGRETGRLGIDVASVSLHDDTSGYDVRNVTGRLDNGVQTVNVTFAAERQAAKISGRVESESGTAARRLQADVDLASVDLEALLVDPKWQSDVTVHAHVDASLPEQGDPVVNFAVDGVHAAAFGYEGTDIKATGTWTRGNLSFKASASGYGAAATVNADWQVSAFAGRMPAFDGSGKFQRVSLPLLPKVLKMPPLSSRLAGDYRVHQDATAWHASVVLAESVVEQATIAAGTVGTIAQRDGQMFYSAAGSLARLDLQRLAGPIDVQTLAEARFRSRLTGHFSVTGREGCHGCAVPRWLVAHAEMADAQVADTTMSELTTGMALVGSQLSVVARGRAAHLTAETMGTPPDVAMDLNGLVDGGFVLRDVHAPFTISGIDVDGKADLAASTIAGVKIDSAHVDTTITNGLATIREGLATAEGLKVTATGTAAFGDTGTNALDVTVDVDDLHDVAPLSGLQLVGAGRLEAHLTGPRDEPHATGILTMHDLAYGTDASALTFHGTLDATMPKWQPSAAVVSLVSDATFVKVKSFEISKLTGKASYASNAVDLDLDLADASRELHVAGALSLATEDRALTVRALAMTTAGETWSLPEGTPAILRADATHVDVRGLTLANGAQHISAEGAMALSAAAPANLTPLQVTLENVQLADANRIVLGTRRLEGLVNGDVTFAGTPDDPRVDGRLSIDHGMVEKTPFESLRGQASLSSHDLTFDATLVQSGTIEIKASGHVPIGAGSVTSPRPMQVAVTSSPIDLGLAQLFTDTVTEIAGTAQVNLQVSGSPQSPIIDGTIRVDNGAFTLAGSGVRYTGTAAALVFKANHLTIDSLQLKDDDGHTLSAVGNLDVLGKAEDRAFDVRITADRVHVLNNELGSLQMNADVRFSGDLAAPKFDGKITLDSGRLQADQILRKTTNNPYSETPADLGLEERPARGAAAVPPPAGGVTPAPAGPAVAPPAAGIFSRVALDLDVELPDNLVMRGRGLRVGQSAIGLGDMNIIAGGSLRVRKSSGGPLDIVGDLELVRGTYSFQGRRFDVQRGSTVQFRGSDPTDPGLNVSAERDVSGVAATVHVRGTAKRPELNLSSQPPLDEAEILSLIVFGQPLGDLGSGQRTSLAEQAGIMAAGAITTPLADSIAQALDLDVFEILAPSDTEALPVVSVGSQIGSRVYIGAKREIGGDSTAVSFEYRFAKFLRLVTSFAQGALQAHTLERSEAAGIDLLFVFRY